MASIKDVAKAAGVSTATVSYVLNNSRKVGDAVRDRVLAAAEQLGYHPNLIARQLAAGTSTLLGMLVPSLRNPFFPEVVTGFQDQAMARGLDVAVLSTKNDSQKAHSIIDRLIGIKVAGIAVMTSNLDSSCMDHIERRSIPTVYLDLPRSSSNVSSILIDYERGVLQAVTHLLALGHTRIGFIGGLSSGVSARRRKAAFQKATGEDPRVVVSVIDSNYTVEGGYSACSALLYKFRPQAIVCANDLMAIGALHCAYDQGARVPEDLSIVGFDDILFARYTQPALTTVAIPRAEIGERAFEAIWSRLRGLCNVYTEYRVEPSLVLRESTGPSVRGKELSGDSEL